MKETPIKREIRQSAEREQSLRRSRCMSNTQEGQEVVDIPLMKTPLLAKTLSSKAGPGQGADWQFSEKKMQKEISQEIQRELVLVNMGKIPGVYSKGTVRQMRESKLLFEAFQQGNAEGPTRHRRPPTAGLGMRGHVYPSVLERTRSMELVSFKGFCKSFPYPISLFPYSLSCLSAVDGRHSTGKLDRTWPPPNPKSARENPGQTQVQLYFPRSILPVTGTQHVIHSQALIAIILYVCLC
uniref:Uncharacterized protein n=1 Tax=Salmo trutta TaxID=8032 RepID=A0A674D6H5_SALTR